MRLLLSLPLLILGVVIALWLGGCATLEERPLIEGVKLRTIQLTRSYTALTECARDGSLPPGWTTSGCAYLNWPVCEIKVPPDATDDTLGHEARHCFDGAWHR